MNSCIYEVVIIFFYVNKKLKNIIMEALNKYVYSSTSYYFMFKFKTYKKSE